MKQIKLLEDNDIDFFVFEAKKSKFGSKSFLGVISYQVSNWLDQHW